MANSDHTRIGKEFQHLVQQAVSIKYGAEFEEEPAIPIGTPPKDHYFDLASKDRSIVAECKRYTWTISGNVPSAKLKGLNEAVFYFGFLPENTTKLLCMSKAISPRRQETLAEYYYRCYGHLLEDVHILEISEDGTLREITEVDKL